MSRMIFNSKSNQGVVVQRILDTRELLRCERELERREVEPQSQLARQRQRLESRESPRRQKLASFSRSTLFDGSFLFHVGLPSDEHFARFHEVFRNPRILCVCEHFHLPRDHEKKLCEIKARDRCFYGNCFAILRHVSGPERPRERFKQLGINSLCQSLSLRLIDVRQKALPDQICIFQFGHDWDELRLQNRRGGGDVFVNGQNSVRSSVRQYHLRRKFAWRVE